MTQSTIVEYAGKMIVTNEKLPYSQLWFLVKNATATHAYELSLVHESKETFNCTFSQEIEDELENLTSKLYIKTCIEKE